MITDSVLSMDKCEHRNFIPLKLYLPLLWGTFLRFQGLIKQPLFLDEAFTADLVLRNWPDMIRSAYQDVHPLLFYVLSKLVLNVFPLGEWGLRLLPAFCSVLALILAAGIVRRYFGIQAGILTAWLLSWSSLHLYYAQDARMYTLLNLLWLIAPWFLYKISESQTVWACLGWGVTVSAAIHTQFYGLLLWATGFVWILLFWGTLDGKTLRWWLISQMGALIVALPLIGLVASTFSKGVGGAWVPSVHDPIRLWDLALFGFTPERSRFLHGDLLSFFPWKNLPRAGFTVLALITTIPSLVGLIRSDGKDNHRGFLLTAIIFGSFPILGSALLLMVMKQPFWSYRPLIGATTWCLMAFAVGWSAFGGVKWIWVLLFLINLGPVMAFKTYWIKDYGAIAFKRWSDEVPPKTVLVLDRFYHSVVFNFYKPTNVGSVYGIVPRGEIYGLMEVSSDGTLKGLWKPADCSALSQSKVSLYDPAGRRFQEGASWPFCLQDKGGWVFNAQTLNWERTRDIVP